jgi:hypothetical protein
MAEPTEERAQPTGGADQPYADPEDVQFGKAAAEKAEAADRAAADGDPEIVEEGDQEASPRPGSKAEPA